VPQRYQHESAENESFGSFGIPQRCDTGFMMLTVPNVSRDAGNQLSASPAHLHDGE
jgi:hypothetical protein